MPTKQAALELLNKLPDECTWDDIMTELFVRQKIEAGIADADAGRVVSHKEVFVAGCLGPRALLAPGEC